MTERLITHLRHVDVAVPDYAKQLDFYTATWGLRPEHSDDDLGPVQIREDLACEVAPRRCLRAEDYLDVWELALEYTHQ